ncbi:MAG: M48 family metalloprotease [Steroidobacteraceae bacterium]
MKRTLWLAGLLLALAACGTNPVTGKRELQIVSQSQEIQVGAENFAPSRQMQGGDLTIDPELTAYVSEVGQRVASAAGALLPETRQLPYEFKVLNNSVPNAWALPGGKIAVNRGLLTQLHDEAELAAVLGHEITHAAARHGAKSMERGMLLQAAMVGLQVGVRDNQYANLIVGGAMLGANLITQKYGRDAENESDLYGMRYMKAAGYDPAAAIDLQKTFVKLSAGRQTSWLDGLFASHPPSEERVAHNTETAAQLGAGGERGAERYTQKLALQARLAPAYAKYDAGVEALAKGDLAGAEQNAKAALGLESREGKFHELLGDVELKRKNYAAAKSRYERALALNPEYFKPLLASGIASFELGQRQQAQDLFTRSMQLLPTATGSFYLGKLAKQAGNVDEAVKYFSQAAGSQSDVGAESAREAALLDLPRNPSRYVRIEPRLDNSGVVWLLVENRAPVAVRNVEMLAGVAAADGRIAQGPVRVSTGNAVLKPGQVAQLKTSLGPLASADLLRAVRFEVQGAAIAE